MSTTTPSPTAPKYLAHIDGLRAAAVLSVMVYHLGASLLPGGFVGVDVFFVISGFVVTASLATHQDETLMSFLGRFYARRLARLAPALLTMLLATTLTYVLLIPKAWFNRAADNVGQAAFWGFSNWALDKQTVNYFEPRAEFNPFTHTWSLGVEEQFYLIAPLLLFTVLSARSKPQSRKFAVIAMGLLCMASLLACFYFGMRNGSRFVFYQVTFRFWELGAGVILFMLSAQSRGFESGHRHIAQRAGWIGLALVTVSAVMPGSQAYPWVRALIAVIGTVLLIGAPLVQEDSFVRRLFSAPIALWIGQRSYALYLWHWPIFVFFRWTIGLNTWVHALLALGLSTIIATLSYRWIEHPIRTNAKLRSLPAAWRLAGFALVLGLGWQGGRMLLEAQPKLGLGQPTRNAEDWYGDRQLLRSALQASRQCEPRLLKHSLDNIEGAVFEYSPVDCPVKTASQLFVIGDSHAVAYLPMFEQLAAEQGRTVRVLQAAGCGYVDLIEPIEQARDPYCHRMSLAAMRKVLELSRPGDIVFLPSLRLPRLIELGGHKRAVAKGGAQSSIHRYERSPTELQALEAAARDAPQWFVPFLKAGLRVVFEAPKPILRAHPFYCVDSFNRNNPDCSDGLSERRVDQEAYRAPTVNTLRLLTRQYPGIEIWDPLPVLCDLEHCNALLGGRPLFFDGDHVSPYGNLVLHRSFGQAIAGTSS